MVVAYIKDNWSEIAQLIYVAIILSGSLSTPPLPLHPTSL